MHQKNSENKFKKWFLLQGYKMKKAISWCAIGSGYFKRAKHYFIFKEKGRFVVKDQTDWEKDLVSFLKSQYKQYNAIPLEEKILNKLKNA